MIGLGPYPLNGGSFTVSGINAPRGFPDKGCGNGRGLCVGSLWEKGLAGKEFNFADHSDKLEFRGGAQLLS